MGRRRMKTTKHTKYTKERRGSRRRDGGICFRVFRGFRGLTLFSP
jgi:hypothetical protein